MIATGSFTWVVMYGWLAAQVFAQSPDATTNAVASITQGISQPCQVAVTGLISSDLSDCLNFLGLVDVITAQGSLVNPLNNWMKGLCAKQPCSQQTLSTAESSIKQGCQQDIAQNNEFASTVLNILNNQDGLRGVTCLQAKDNNNSVCATELLTNVERTTNVQLSLSQVESMIGGGAQAMLQELNEVPASAYCNDCGQAIFIKTEALSTDPTEVDQVVKAFLSKQCGKDFVAGVPSSVQEVGPDSQGGVSGGSGSGSGGDNDDKDASGDSAQSQSGQDSAATSAGARDARISTWMAALAPTAGCALVAATMVVWM